ncbi:alpha/beta hydrolase [Methylobacterium sp. A54F]
MRILLTLLLTITGLYAAGIAALAIGQRRLIYPGAYLGGAPQGTRSVPSGLEPISLTTGDGERLYALWRAPRPGCGVVISFHGNGSQPEEAARFAADGWAAAGWGVIAPAYRGYRGSTGSPSEDGLIADGIATYLEAARRAPGAPILLHGHSLGTAVAVAVAARAPHLGLYLEAPFDSLEGVVRRTMPYVPTLFLRDTFRSAERIAGLSGPVLIVHGSEDPIVPVKLGRRLANAAGRAARFVAVPGDHVSILGVRDAEAEALFRATAAEACPPAAAARAQ